MDSKPLELLIIIDLQNQTQNYNDRINKHPILNGKTGSEDIK